MICLAIANINWFSRLGRLRQELALVPPEDSRARKLWMVPAALAIAGLSAAFLALMYLLERLGIRALVQHAFIGIVAVLILIRSFPHIRAIPQWLEQKRALDRLRLPERMTRREIAQYFDAFRFESIQRKFVRQLSLSRIVATGEWPEHFKLLGSGTPAVMELAKLEEQWLKLDR